MSVERKGTAFQIHDPIALRWSPRAFTDKTVSDEDLAVILEAGRWAPSCFNEQPWFFMVAKREAPQDFKKMLDCLVEFNQYWAKHAPVLMISVAKTFFERNQKDNRHAEHDVGLAAGTLSVQAAAMGIMAHQMAGFDSEKTRAVYHIPEGYKPMAAFAIGYAAPADTLEGELKEREKAVRERKLLSSFVYSGDWGKSWAIVNGK